LLRIWQEICAGDAEEKGQGAMICRQVLDPGVQMNREQASACIIAKAFLALPQQEFHRPSPSDEGNGFPGKRKFLLETIEKALRQSAETQGQGRHALWATRQTTPQVERGEG